MGALTFDDAPDVSRTPAGAPSVPISTSNTDIDASGQPSVPISTSNTALTFDNAPDISPEARSKARIQSIAQQMKRGAPYTPGPIDFIADAATLSTARPISAAAGALLGGATDSYPGSTFGERYKAGVQFMNDRARLAEQMTGPVAPIVGGLAQIPATMATGGGGQAPASTLRVMGQAAIPGAIEGASQHAGSVEDAVIGGATNAAVSAGTAGVLDQAMKYTLPAARRGAAAEATAARGDTPDMLKADAKALYRDLDSAGIAYSPQQTANLYAATHNLRNTAQYSPNANPTLTDYFDQLQTLTRGPATFNQLHDIRSALALQARGPDESTRVAAGKLIGEIDRLINSGPPALNPRGVDIQTTYPEASRLWRAASVAEDANWIADKTARREAWKSGVSPDEMTRGNFARLEERIDKPGNYDPFTAQQRDLLSNVIEGGRVQNALGSTGDALRGRFAPWAGGAAGLSIPTLFGLSKNVDPVLTTALAGVSGATAAGGVNQLGRAFQNAAANRGQENVNALIRNITGSAAPVPGAAITRGDLAKILFAQDLERLAPRIGSQLIGNPEEEKRP